MSVDITDDGFTVVVDETTNSVTVTSPGPQGAVGPGVPVGGATGDLLVKNSATDYDTAWTDSPTVDMLTFDVSAGDEPDAAGELAWDADAGTVDLRMTGNVLQHVGQDVYYRVQADEAIAKGDLVMAVGTVGNSGIILVAKAATSYGMMTDIPSQRLMGLAASAIADGAQGYVLHFGKLRQINTSMFSEGDILYADPTTPGGLTATQPSAPNWKTIIALVITDSAQAGELFVRPTFGSSLANDELVTLTNVTSGQVLTFNGSVWVNGTPTPSTASYVTLSSDGTLTNERVLTAGTGVTVTDAGAGSTVTVATSAILPTVVDAKGDLIAGTAADTVARVPASTLNGQVLTVDTAQPTGMGWVTPTTDAPVSASYVTLSTDGTLTSERVLTAGTGISVTDAGAGSTVTVATSAILPTVVDAKGDLIAGTADNTVARLGVGANDTVLMAASGETTGLAWRSPRLAGGAARPLLTGGAYLDGTTGLVLTGLSGNYASAPDSAALSITGDIDLRARISLNDWTPSGDAVVITKWTPTGNQRSYYFTVRNNGTLQLVWSTDGTAGTAGSATSTVATGVADGATKWVRVTMDVDNGASGRTIEFFLSDDGVTWTQLGTTVTQAGTTSIFDSTAIVEFGSHSVGTGPSASGGVWQRAQILSGINGTTQLDANFASQTADALAFTESSTNAATVTINTTRYTVGLPGVDFNAVTALATTADRDYYLPFIVTAPTVVDMFLTEVTAAAGAASTMQLAIYNADGNQQPTGSPIVTDSISIGNGTSGVFSKQFTAVTLQPGRYLLAHNHSATSLTLRTLRGGQTLSRHTIGSSPMATELYVARSNAAFTSSPSAWTIIGASSGGASLYKVFLRWRPA